jgi:hypothetical protein
MKFLSLSRGLTLVSWGVASFSMLLLATSLTLHSLAQTNEVTEPERNPCLDDPDSPACDTYQMLQDLLRDREDRQQQALDEFVQDFAEEFGYNPKDYELSHRISGSNITIFDKSDWATFHVLPEEGIIEVGHTAATRDAFWGTTVWHDHEMISVTFTLDDDACKVISEDSTCTFTGTDTINLGQNFLTNHQIIKHGEWEINYIESGEEKGVILRVPEDALPTGAEGVNINDYNRRYCRLFPESLDCL